MAPELDAASCRGFPVECHWMDDASCTLLSKLHTCIKSPQQAIDLRRLAVKALDREELR